MSLKDAGEFHCMHCNISFPFQSKYDRHLKCNTHRHFATAMDAHLEDMDNTSDSTISSESDVEDEQVMVSIIANSF